MTYVLMGNVKFYCFFSVLRDRIPNLYYQYNVSPSVRVYTSLVSNLLRLRVHNGRDSDSHRLVDPYYAHSGNLLNKLNRRVKSSVLE